MLLAEATGYAAGVRRTALALCAAALAAPLGVWASPLAAQASQDAQTLAEQAIRRLDLQTELPRQPEPFGLNLSLPPEILWAVIIVGVGVLLYAFRDMIPILRASHGGTWAEDEAGASEMGSRAPEAVLGAADDLAAQGRFVEAMHVLLLQAFARDPPPARRTVRRFNDQPRNPAQQPAVGRSSPPIARGRQLASSGPISASIPLLETTISPADRASARWRTPCTGALRHDGRTRSFPNAC